MKVQKLYDINEVCNQFGNIGKNTIYRWIQEGKFPKGVKVSTRRVAWPESAIAKRQQELIDDARRGSDGD